MFEVRLVLLLIVLLLSNYSIAEHVIGCTEKERQALLDLKAGLLMNGPDLLPSWKNEDDQKSSDCCDWEGVTCSNLTGHVEMLDLNGINPPRHFRGEIRTSLMELQHLQYLNLSYNYFTDRHVPEFIGSLINLRFLDLKASHFGGTIPNDLAKLSLLQYLDLSLNTLVGTIPQQLGNLSHLQYLNIWGNGLDGTVPHQLGGLSNLQQLHLGMNLGLEIGTKQLFNNNKLILKSIDLSSNKLTGDIPEEIGSLVGLVSLNLSRNSLNGKITSEIGRLTSLDFLNLSRNHFFGSIPPTLAQIDRLSVFDVSYNNLSGRIPIGTQLQSFNASSYEGNLDLCGKPLDTTCPGDEAPPQEPKTLDKSSPKDKNPIYLSMALGFITGFWGLLGSLLLNHTWRHAYFSFLNNMIDTIYVTTVVNGTKIQRWLKGLLEKSV